MLNAIHQKKLRIRILTNNYTQPTCADKIAPLDWLYLNGIQVHFYTSTTFMHAKFVMIDYGKRTSISSVNWSRTSFTENREAGVVLEDCSCSAIDFYKSVFEYDWNAGIDYVLTHSYTKSEMDTITDPSYMPYTVPSPRHYPGAYVTRKETHTGVSIKKAYTTDYARDTIFSYFPDIKSSIQV